MRPSSSSVGVDPLLAYELAYDEIVLWSLSSSSCPWLGLLSYETVGSACRGRLITSSSDERADELRSGVALPALRMRAAGVEAPAGEPFAGDADPLLEDRVRGIGGY